MKWKEERQKLAARVDQQCRWWWLFGRRNWATRYQHHYHYLWLEAKKKKKWRTTRQMRYVNSIKYGFSFGKGKKWGRDGKRFHFVTIWLAILHTLFTPAALCSGETKWNVHCALDDSFNVKENPDGYVYYYFIYAPEPESTGAHGPSEIANSRKKNR